MRSSVAQQNKPLRFLLKDLRQAVGDNDFREAQRLRSALAKAKRAVEGPSRDGLDDLFEIIGQWVQNVGNRHDNKRLIQQSIRRILTRLAASKKGPTTEAGP
jgi:hypothetical protein